MWNTTRNNWSKENRYFFVSSKTKIKDGKLLEDDRKGKSGRQKTKQLNKDEEIRQLKHKIKYQEQQIEFLKKISFVEKKAKWESSKKNTR